MVVIPITLPSEDLRTCIACESTRDLNYAACMREMQRLHRAEQMHFWQCGFLRESYLDDPGIAAELYDTPWDTVAKEAWFCSDDCESAYLYTGDFQYRTCEGCERLVCQQNPSNGWMWQYRNHAGLGEICLQCYETEILKNGQPRSDFEGDRINGGMFFSHGNREAHARGFEEVDGFEYFFVDSHERARRYNERALGLSDRGNLVITAWERMAIGNLEGTSQ